MGYLKKLWAVLVYAVQSHPRSLILVPIECDFLLVRHSILGSILHRFGNIAVFCAPEWPTPIPP